MSPSRLKFKAKHDQKETVHMAYDSLDFSLELAEVTTSAVSPSAPVTQKIEGNKGPVVWKKTRWMIGALAESQDPNFTPPWARSSRAESAPRIGKTPCDMG